MLSVAYFSSFGEEFVPHVQPESLLAQLEAISS